MEKPRQCFWKQPNTYIFVFSCVGHDDDYDENDDYEGDDDTDEHDNDS